LSDLPSSRCSPWWSCFRPLDASPLKTRMLPTPIRLRRRIPLIPLRPTLPPSVTIPALRHKAIHKAHPNPALPKPLRRRTTLKAALRLIRAATMTRLRTNTPAIRITESSLTTPLPSRPHHCLTTTSLLLPGRLSLDPRLLELCPHGLLLGPRRVGAGSLRGRSLDARLLGLFS
jgi:hypothetical protein